VPGVSGARTRTRPPSWTSQTAEGERAGSAGGTAEGRGFPAAVARVSFDPRRAHVSVRERGGRRRHGARDARRAGGRAGHQRAHEGKVRGELGRTLRARRELGLVGYLGDRAEGDGPQLSAARVDRVRVEPGLEAADPTRFFDRRDDEVVDAVSRAVRDLEHVASTLPRIAMQIEASRPARGGASSGNVEHDREVPRPLTQLDDAHRPTRELHDACLDRRRAEWELDARFDATAAHDQRAARRVRGRLEAHGEGATPEREGDRTRRGRCRRCRIRGRRGLRARARADQENDEDEPEAHARRLPRFARGTSGFARPTTRLDSIARSPDGDAVAGGWLRNRPLECLGSRVVATRATTGNRISLPRAPTWLVGWPPTLARRHHFWPRGRGTTGRERAARRAGSCAENAVIW